MEVSLERVVRFYYVAEGLSFVKAAQRMNVDQTWLSRQIQQLETQLDCRLLERSTRHVALTAEGEEFFEAARELAEAAKKVRTLAGSLGTPRRREMTLGLSDTTFWVPEQQRLIDMAATRHPELTVKTLVRSGSALMQQLRAHQVDICVAGMAEDMSELDYVTIHKSRPGLLIPEEHPLAAAPSVRMADLANVEFAVPVIDNKVSFQQIYKPFIDTGATPHWVSEGPLAAMHYAAVHRLFLVAWGFNIVAHGFALRPVADCTALIQVIAARNMGDDREAVRKFWASAVLTAAHFEKTSPELKNEGWRGVINP